MNKHQSRRNVQAHGVGKQIPGCLGRMVNLFDFGTVNTGKKLLTEKPHFDDGSTKKNQFDQIEDKVDVRYGVNGTPMKMLLEQEMSKEMEFKLGSTNLVAKLMGLDSFPQTQPASRSNRLNPCLKRSLSQGEYKDVYEVWQKPGDLSSNGVEGLSKKKIDIVREKFLEAKRLVTDDKLRHSKEFQEAMEYLSSNKELFLEFLQESNNFFSNHLHSFQSTAPQTTEKSKRITILKPSIGNEEAIESLRDRKKSEKSLPLFKWPVEEEYPSKQSTRIVVLKPNVHVRKSSSCPTSPRGFEEKESRDGNRRVKTQMLKEETLHSSVFSNGYIGDDSSLNRSENDYVDSEIMSPVSRHSWEYINKYDSPFSSSPFSRASGSPESSSVCREAKKRLSERWSLMTASNENFHEAKVIQKGSNSTLGDMLALPDFKEDLRTGEEVEETCNDNEQEGSRVSASCLTGNVISEKGKLRSPKTLTRSKSLPESSTSLGHKSLATNKGNSKVPEGLTKSKSLKWSLKGKVSNFLFSRNKKDNKERSYEKSQVANLEVLDSRCNDQYDASASARISREGGLSIARSTTFGNSSEWLDEPSPISVLETSFDKDDGIFFKSSILNRSSSSLEPEMKSKLLGKSPPIGSIGRTFSLDDSSIARCYSSKRSTTSTKDEEEDLRLLINTLLSAADFDSVCENLLSKWHSAESPLDPSMRNSYTDSTEQQKLGSNIKKLAFDLVNALLMELIPSYLGPSSPMILSGNSLQVHIINRMKECLKGNRRVEDRWWDEDGDLSSLAVNKVVRIEVADIGSPESLRLEMDSMGEELELKLLEELVEETLMDLSQHSKYLLIL